MPTEPSRRRRLLIIAGLAALGAAVVAAITTTVLISVVERKAEAKQPFFRVVALTEETEDPAVWGQNFPLQYDAYRRTVDQSRTRYGGSEALPRTPTAADPRSVVAQSRLAEDPRLQRMWAGYAFAVDFREERGHAYMLEDQTYTERQKVTKQPGTCINCHASTYVAMRKLGGGNLQAGFAKLNAMPYAEARTQVTHPVTCIDCHDPVSLQLRVTRPAFMTGIAAVKAREGVQNYDVNRSATRQEMRSYVCGQCHVEYYFAGPEKTLTYPWTMGRRADDILAYYEANGHKDFTHAQSGAPVLKAQHPEFELWSQGIHARAGVACADCHMPYRRVGGLKVSDHHVRSPLLSINAACQTCHRADEDELLARVHTIQQRHAELRDHALDALLDLVDAIVAAQAAGADEARLTAARASQRRAQFLVDFAEAENSTGFHAPQEAARVLGLSIDHARKGLKELYSGR